MSRSTFLHLFVAGCGCRVEPPDPGGDGPLLAELDLGSVPVGATLAVRLPVADLPGAPDGDARIDSPRMDVVVADGAIDIHWAPTGEATAEARVAFPPDGFVVLRAEGVAAVEVWPDPIATLIGTTALASLPETGLGDAALDGDDALPFAYDPVSGNAFLGDGALGRAWRVDLFYNHSQWGLWVSDTKSGSADWKELPDCFTDPAGMVQDGTCDGSEVDSDGEVPRGWHYYHGGFAGDGELAEIAALVADPDRGRAWALGPGWLRAIDTELVSTSDEGQDAYSFTQVVPGFSLDLGPEWALPWAAVDGEDLVVVDRSSGRVGRLALPPGGEAPAELAAASEAVAGAAMADGSLYLARAGGITALDPATGEVQWEAPFAAEAVEGEVRGAWAEAGRAWFAWGDVLVFVSEGEASLVLAPEVGGTFAGVALDRVSGGTAEDADVLYVAGEVDGVGRLWAATPDGHWLGEPIPLPAPPRAMGHARDAHDLYVVYAEGDQGCVPDETAADAQEFAATCDDGLHPAVVQSFYDPYGLVPPASRGHLLNLFLSPVIETPKDGDVDSDFTNGVCAKETGAESGCCSLAWSLTERVEPNVEYFMGALGVLGAKTKSTGDDPAFAWGINPSFLRQARQCIATGDEEMRQAGIDAWLAMAGLVGDRSELTAWTHTTTALGGPDDGSQDWFMSLLYEEGVDYVLPLDSQAEYQMLHDGLAAVFDPAGLEAAELDGLAVWMPMASGNALDAEEIVDETYGWPDDDASWVVPVRDGPLAIGQPARKGYYFLSAGALVGIGTDTWRKKELWPIDVRERMHLSELPELVTDLGEPGESGLVNIPGLSWEMGILSNLSDAGGYRESMIYGQTVDERDWDFQFRYLRRMAASGDPLQVKGFYQHFFDNSHRNGLYTDNSGVTLPGDPEGDVNAAAIQRIAEELVGPGYARWATPTEILAEWESAR